MTMAARLKETYINEVAPALMKKFEYKSVMQIPKLDKIVVNIACGEARENSKVLDSVVSDLMQITGQRPVMCRAKKSIANFKLREGMVIGAKVTSGETECMSSLTGSSISLFPASETSEVSTRTLSTAEATILWVSRNS